MGKVKVIMEFDMKSAPASLLWTYISTANGLERWFADKVEFNNKDCVFQWNKVPQTAHIVSHRAGTYMRYRWTDDDHHCYFEMFITVSELTGNTLLTVTDFADADEEDDIRDLWTSQIDTLRRVIGCL